VANAGILAASRYPLAMSRDKLLSPEFKKLNSKNIPVNGVLATLLMILLILALFDVEKIAKLASAFQLLLFGALCVAVIVMRESGLASYDPGCKSPFYPWMQIVGIIMPICLIPIMGALSTLFSLGLIIAGIMWYRLYGRKRVTRHGAIFHVFARLGQRREAGLDAELRGILKEKGLRVQDPFDELIIAADVLDIRDDLTFEQVTKLAAKRLERVVPASAEKLVTDIMENTGLGATPVSHGAALPHLRLDNLESPRMVLVRSRRGIHIDMEALIPGSEDTDAPIHAIFFLISPTDDPGRHLRVLAQLATHIDSDEFSSEWLSARDDHDLKQVLLHDERMIAIELHKNKPSGAFIGKPIRDIKLPEACLVALIRRGDESLIPRGHTLLEEGDWLTILGEGPAIKELSLLTTETLGDE
jgi:APA family basic amino acid/polyamine antiporter